MLLDGRGIPYIADDGVAPPRQATDGSAGWDFYAPEAFALRPFETKVVATGIRAAIPESTALLLVARSGLSIKNSLILPNGVGVIDSDYRGIIHVALMWVPDPQEHGWAMSYASTGKFGAQPSHMLFRWNPDAMYHI